MFALSIAFIALAVITGLFALIGVAGPAVGVAAIVIGILGVISMIVYWKRRPPEISTPA